MAARRGRYEAFYDRLRRFLLDGRRGGLPGIPSKAGGQRGCAYGVSIVGFRIGHTADVSSYIGQYVVRWHRRSHLSHYLAFTAC